MLIITANIGRNIGTAAVESDMRRIKRFVRLSGNKAVIGFQEIDEADPADEHEILGKVFDHWHKANFNSRVPIVASPKAKVVKTKAIALHAGIPHTSPPRIATEIWVKHRDDQKPVVYLNWHIVAGA